ncbi:MAG: hypothetical protein DMD81_16935 [Candidatus Rokuibacteriota bacterium]|nr:MAG: hypothetical protein DMD81_16935 [Candidatus Rokubacteria bacterium]
MERVEHPERRDDAEHLARIEPLGRQGDVEGPSHFPFGLRLGGGLTSRAGHAERGRHGDDEQQHERPARAIDHGVSFVLLIRGVLAFGW